MVPDLTYVTYEIERVGLEGVGCRALVPRDRSQVIKTK